MSLVKAREQRMTEQQSGGAPDSSLLCTWGGGCRNRWSCDFGRGKLCGEHDSFAQSNSMTRDRQPRPEPRPIGSAIRLPAREAAKPFCEAAEREE